MKPFEIIKNLYEELESKLTNINRDKFIIEKTSMKGKGNFEFTYTLAVYPKSNLNTEEEMSIVIETNAQNRSHFSINRDGLPDTFYMLSDIILLKGEDNTEIISTNEYLYNYLDEKFTEEHTEALTAFVQDGYHILNNFIIENG